MWSPWSGRPRALCAYLRSTIPTATPSAMQSCKAAKLQTCRPAACCPGAHIAPSRKGRGQLPPCYPKTWHKTRRLEPRTCSLLGFSSTKQQTALTAPCPCGCWVPAGLPGLLGLPVLERLPGMDQQQVGGSALLPRSWVVDATPVRCHLVVGMYGMEDGGPSDS